MAAKHHRHIALTEPLARFVESEVAEGRYASPSEVVRAGLRLLTERGEAGARAASPPTTPPADADGRSHG